MSAEEDLCDLEVLHVERLGLPDVVAVLVGLDYVHDRDRNDAAPGDADHLAGFAARDEVDRLHAESGGEDAVGRGRGAAALDVAQEGIARLEPRPPFDIP